MFVVGLGSNLGSREAFLRAAELLLASHADVEVTARSALYVTPPLGPPQPDYLNAALRLETALAPVALLEVLLDVEARLGRVRRERWGPRCIDLDILFWSGGEVDAPGLTIPHPGLRERAFAMAPLLDVAPELGDRYACAPPPSRDWAPSPEAAIDDLDGQALAATARLGAPKIATRVERFSGEMPEFGPGFVVLENWGDGAGRGAKLL